MRQVTGSKLKHFVTHEQILCALEKDEADVLVMRFVETRPYCFGDMFLTAASFWVITVLTSNYKINASVSPVCLNTQAFHVKKITGVVLTWMDHDAFMLGSFVIRKLVSRSISNQRSMLCGSPLTFINSR